MSPMDRGLGSVTAVPASVTVEASIYGLPNIAFGGYIAGVLAESLGRDGKVDFHAPAPLGRRLSLHNEGQQVSLTLGETVLATARAQMLELKPPRIPSWEEALDGSDEYLGHAPIDHPYCFGCGPQRDEGQGLRIFPGLVPRGDLVVAAWRPGSAFAGADEVLSRFVWAAMDCPGAWARRRLANAQDQAVTAYLAVGLIAPVLAHSAHIVFAWSIDRSGRKSLVGTAIASQEGKLCAVSEALWLDVA